MKVPLKKSRKIQVKRADDIYPVMREILLRESKIRRKQDFFWVVALNNAYHIDNIELVALGAVNRVSVSAVEVFSIPIQKRCKSIILVHNHPSGKLVPSQEDIDFTKKFVAAADILGITIHDHIIITEEEYLSILPPQAGI